MSNLTLRRIFVWSVSLVLGFVITWAMYEFMFPALIPQEGPKNFFEDYGNLYKILTIVPIALIFVAWLDYFMDTRIHPD